MGTSVNVICQSSHSNGLQVDLIEVSPAWVYVRAPYSTDTGLGRRRQVRSQ